MQGPAGSQGAQGPAGSQGAQGPAGSQGVPGTSYTGPTGVFQTSYTGTIQAGNFVTTTGGLVTSYGVVTTAIQASGPLGSVIAKRVDAAYISTTGANVRNTLQAGEVTTPYLTVPAYADISATGIYFTASGAPGSGTLNCTKGVMSDLAVPGVAELSSTGIMLTGGPTTYVKNVYADAVYAPLFYATGAGARIVGGSVNVSDVSTYSLEP